MNARAVWSKMAAVAAIAIVGFATPSKAQDLTGAGATFPYPIYSKWFSDYAAKTGVKINYQAIGSGGGKRQISDETVDFGASDGPMSDAEMAKMKGGPVFHIPTVMGGVVVIYNIPGVTAKLKFTGALLADIYLGKITKWNDPRIAVLNKGVTLPNQDILVVHRSDGSGTTFIWTDYLSSVSPAWAAGPSKGTDVSWPVGLGGKGNEGVSGQVKQVAGAIGYVELIYAKQNHMSYALIQNASGAWVDASIASVTAAAAGVARGLPRNTDFRISIVNAPGKDAYPIASPTWLLVYKHMPNAGKGRKLLGFIKWMLTEGQKEAPSLDYAPLPPAIVKQIEARLSEIKIG